MKSTALVLFFLAASLSAQQAPPSVAPRLPSVQAPNPVLPSAPPSDAVSSFDAAPARTFRNTAQVQLDLLMASVPETQALALRSRLGDPASVTQAQAELLEMIGRKQARLIDWPSLTLHDGERSVAEAIIEERYPTEFGISEPSEDAKGKAVSTSNAPHSDSLLTSPSTFETRNTGSTLEAEVHVSPDAKAVSVQVVPQWVAMDQKLFPISSAKDAPSISQPIVKTGKVNTAVTLQHGESRLIYFGKPSSASDVVIFILTAHIQPPKTR